MEREQKFHLDIPLNCPPLDNSPKPSSAAPAPAAKPEAPAKVAASPQTARARGQSLGAAFATLNSGDFARAGSFVSAIERGERSAAAQDAHAQAIADDPESLRDMGFWGVDRDDD